MIVNFIFCLDVCHYIGEGNGNPCQRSCLENPRDRGAWWAAIYGVAQSWTRLKLLSNSNMPLPECVTICLFISHLLAIHISPLVKHSTFLSIFFFSHWVLKFPYIFQMQILSHICDLQIFSPSLWLIFQALNSRQFESWQSLIPRLLP